MIDEKPECFGIKRHLECDTCQLDEECLEECWKLVHEKEKTKINQKISIAEEIGIIISNLEAEERREEVIQSIMYLVREKGAKDFIHKVTWRLPSICVNAPEVSLKIYQLIDRYIIDFSQDRKYFLTERGKGLLLNRIQENALWLYISYIHRILILGYGNKDGVNKFDGEKIIMLAREKFLENKKEKRKKRESEMII